MAIDNLGMFQGRPVEQKKIQLGNLGQGTYKGIVTPQMQRMGGINKTGYKIEDIIEKEVVRDRFQRNEFPQFEKTSDGIFFQPIGKVFSTFGNYYIKWFSLSKDLEFSHDHDYDYARLNTDGYLMKISAKMVHDKINDFEVNYVTRADNIVPITVTVRPEGANIDSLASDPIDMYTVPPFNASEFPSLVQVFMEHENFVNMYLSDIIKNQ